MSLKHNARVKVLWLNNTLWPDLWVDPFVPVALPATYQSQGGHALKNQDTNISECDSTMCTTQYIFLKIKLFQNIYLIIRQKVIEKSYEKLVTR